MADELGPITRGCDWSGTVELKPPNGKTRADVVTEITGGTVTAVLRYGGASEVTCAASVSDASAREVSVSLTAAQTAAIGQTGEHTLDVRVTGVTGTWPVTLRDRRVHVGDQP